MRGKVLIGIVSILTIAGSAFFGAAAAEQKGVEPLAEATPVAKSVPRSLVFLDAWDGTKIAKTDAEWKKELSSMEFYVLRQQGTERAYTGALTDNKKQGTYYCAACGLALFSSKHKYNSETGWPSFYQTLNKANIGETEDKIIPEEVRTEVHCNRCGGHLGHVFDDGPEPTGLRYCINSAALRFRESK